MTLDELKQAVQFLRPGAVHTSKTDPRSRTASPNWKAAVDNSGNAAIDLWNPALGPEPTTEQLTAAIATSDLADAQSAQSAKIAAAYKKAKYQTPITVTVGRNTLSFPTDEVTQMEVLSYLVTFNAANAPAQMPLEDASGNMQMLTYGEIQAVAKAITASSIAAHKKHNELQAQISAARSRAEIRAITWPSKI